MAQNQRTPVPMEHGDIPPREPLPLNSDEQVPCQLQNSPGGFVWEVDDMKRLHRFLVLGSELPTYYIGDKELGRENAQAIWHLLSAGRGIEVVNEILNFSLEGRTAKQNPIMFALAMCARLGDLQTKQRAYEVFPQICRIPTHLFLFVQYSERLSKPGGTGWGRAPRKAIQKWYTEKPPMKLAMDVTKYQKREGWSHADVARLAHPKFNNPGTQCVLKYVVKGFDEMMAAFTECDVNSEELNSVLHFLKAVEEMKKLTMENEDRVVELIQQHHLVREHIPTVCLGSVKVWDALLKEMPMTAMIRNLNKMTAIGLLAQGSEQAQSVCEKLGSGDQLKKARIHPFNVLLALRQYKSGRSGGVERSLTWTANTDITEALEKAFYLSFKNVEPTRKRHMLALDVSRSMEHGGCVGAPYIQPRIASAAMAMVTARTEELTSFVAFSDTIVEMNINSDMRLEEVVDVVYSTPAGSTDCAQPMMHAMANDLMIDVFVVYTDNETWCGEIHPSEALKQYRGHSGIHDAKLIVVGMTSNGFTIADPEDPGMFDMAGFDSAAPQVMREFILGNI